MQAAPPTTSDLIVQGGLVAVGVVLASLVIVGVFRYGVLPVAKELRATGASLESAARDLKDTNAAAQQMVVALGTAVEKLTGATDYLRSLNVKLLDFLTEKPEMRT